MTGKQLQIRPKKGPQYMPFECQITKFVIRGYLERGRYNLKGVQSKPRKRASLSFTETVFKKD